VIILERILRVLQPAYSSDLARRSDDELHAMKHECSTIETSVSYARRLAQARIEILEAEKQRRAEGGSIAELIDALPNILAGDASRATAAHTRLAEPDEEIIELEWPDARERLLADDSLANLPNVDDTDLSSTIDALRGFERDLSAYRHSLHGVIAGIEHEIATRAAAGA
jgi:hypothetical protein